MFFLETKMKRRSSLVPLVCSFNSSRWDPSVPCWTSSWRNQEAGSFSSRSQLQQSILCHRRTARSSTWGIGKGFNEAWVLSWRKILWHCFWHLNDLPSASKKCIRGYKNLFKSDLLGCSSESGACNTICTFVKLNFRFSNCCCQPCTCNEEAFCATLDIFKTSLQFIDFKMNLFFGRDLYRLKILLCNFHFVQNWIWSLKFELFEHWLTLLKRKGESISQEAPQTWFHLTIFQLQRHNWILDILWGLVEVEIVTSIRWFLSVPPQNWQKTKVYPGLGWP